MASLDRPWPALALAAEAGLTTPDQAAHLAQLLRLHRHRDAVSDHAKLFFAGRQVRQVRNADGLAAVLTGYFKVPVRVESFVGHWMALPKSERTRLPSRADRALGATAALERVTAAAFGQRRKMLRQSLRSLDVDVPALLAAAGIDGTKRAEEIGVAGFVALANAYRAHRLA